MRRGLTLALVLGALIIPMSGLRASGTPFIECPILTCGAKDGKTYVAGSDIKAPRARSSAAPVASSSGAIARWTDCGPNIAKQAVDAYDLGTCFDPLRLCALMVTGKPDPNVHVFLVVTTFPDGTRSSRNECNVDVRGRVLRVGPADVRAWLVKRIPAGGIGTTGPRSLVNVDAVLWLVVRSRYEWGPVTVVQPNVRIRVRLDHVRWDFGDGVSAIAADAGRAYDAADPCGVDCPQYFAHAYRTRKGPVTLRATGYWNADFSVGGGPWLGLAQPVPAAPAPSRELTVVEARSELVGDN